MLFANTTCTDSEFTTFVFQPQPEHGVYTVFVELGDSKIEVKYLLAFNLSLLSITCLIHLKDKIHQNV